jgi:SAM-dependent methyltransferase
MNLYQKHKNFWNATTKEMYDRWKTQDPWVNLYVIPKLKKYFSESNYSLMDAGCGQGILYDKLPENIKKCYFGIDFSPAMIDFFRSNHPEVKITIADIIDTGLCDNFTDITVCLNTLMYFDIDIDKALKELNRLTKNILLISVPLSEEDTHTVTETNIIFNYDEFMKKINTIMTPTEINTQNTNYNYYHLVEIKI